MLMFFIISYHVPNKLFLIPSTEYIINILKFTFDKWVLGELHFGYSNIYVWALIFLSLLLLLE